MPSILSEFINITQLMTALAKEKKQRSQEFSDLNKTLISILGIRDRSDYDEDEIQSRMEELINLVNAVYDDEDADVNGEYVFIFPEDAEDNDDDDVPDLEPGTMSMTYVPNLGLGKKKSIMTVVPDDDTFRN